MIFLGPFYQYVASFAAERYNHWPLIRLIFYSVDKTIFYELIFLLLRGLYLKISHKKITFGHELLVNIFAIYIIMLYALTAFRGIYFPWQISISLPRPETALNLIPFEQTIKLIHGISKIDFFYNLFGNIVWFVPFGIFFPMIHKRRIGMIKTVTSGFCLSLSIEIVQYFLGTGIADIDDLIFNTIGALIGYLIYAFFALIFGHKKSGTHR